MRHFSTIILLILGPLFLTGQDVIFQNNVGINNDGSNPDSSAILDVKSTTKGVLVPRLTLSQYSAIVNPATGLLVYDQSNDVFVFYNGSAWISLTGGAGTDDQTLSLSGTDLAIEDGNSVDLSTIQDGTGSDDQTIALSGTDLSIEDGNSIDLSTIQDGTGSDDQSLTFSGTSLSIEDGNNVDLGSLQDGTGTDAQTLSISGTDLTITNGNTVTLPSGGSGASNINGLTDGKADTKNTFLGYRAGLVANGQISNTAVGGEALEKNEAGTNNTAVGYRSMEDTNGGNNNTAVGFAAMFDNTTGSQNVAVGQAALAESGLGSNNTAVGTRAGQNNDGTYNVFLGALAGDNSTGDHNILIGYQAGSNAIGGNKLIIENTTNFLNTPLIYGEFDNDLLKIGGALSIDDDYTFPIGPGSGGAIMINKGPNQTAEWSSYFMPTAKGTTDQILKSNSGGFISWAADEVNDADASTTNEIQTLSISGQSLSISQANTISIPESPWDLSGSTTYYTDGKVGIGTSTPDANLHIDDDSANESLRITQDYAGIAATKGISLSIGLNSATSLKQGLVSSVLPGPSTSADGIFSQIWNLSGGSLSGHTAVHAFANGIGTALKARTNNVGGRAALFDGDVVFKNTLSNTNEIVIDNAASIVGTGTSSLFFSGDASGDVGYYQGYYPSGEYKLLYKFGTTNIERFKINAAGAIVIGDDDIILSPNGNNDSRITTDELEIKGGSDLAEMFHVEDEVSALPGMLVSIDPYSPEKLTLSKEANSPLLVGVISGANGIDPGLMMGQEGTIAYGDYPVTLVGRVYVKCNVEGGVIEPGDLLTTSSIAGIAMRVERSAIVNGSILGKALSTMDENGFVYALITLQ